MEMEEEEEKLREAQYCSDKPFPYGPLQSGEFRQSHCHHFVIWQCCAPTVSWALVEEDADCLFDQGCVTC